MNLLPSLSFLFFTTALAQAPAVSQELERAGQLLEAGELQAAEEILARLVEKRPIPPDALNMLGVVRAEQKRFQDAEQLFRRAIEADSRLYGAHVNLARLYADRGEFSQALQQLEVIPTESRPPGYAEVAAQIHLSTGDFKQAEENLLQVLQRQPDSIQTLRYLAGVALKLQKPGKAWEYVATMRRLAPNVPEILYLFAEVSLQNNLVQEAILAVRKAILLDPESATYRFLLGKALLESTEFHEARTHFERYVEMKPDDPEGYLALGYAFYLEQDYPKARTHLAKSLQLNPDQVQAYYHLATVAYQLGEDPQAVELLDRVLQNQPNHAPARTLRGKLYLRKGDSQKARSEFESAARLQPEEPTIHYQLSQLYLRLGAKELAQHEQELYQRYQSQQEERTKRSVSLPFTSHDGRAP